MHIAVRDAKSFKTTVHALNEQAKELETKVTDTTEQLSAKSAECEARTSSNHSFLESNQFIVPLSHIF